MNKKELIDYCRKAFDEMANTMEAKNADYAGSGEGAFHNFTMVEKLGITTTEQGILTRMTDKMTRITSLIDGRDAKVKTEAIEDTLKDLANYSVILCAYLHDKRSKLKEL